MSLPARVLVLGLARSGRAAAAALSRRGVTVTAADRRLGNDDDPAALDGVELVVKSPGVPGENALVRAAREREIPVWSEVELGYRLLPDARFVGVTGTNGKTTTVELLGAIFRAAGRDVAVAGNVGRPLTSVEPAEWVVCELSSFQLEDVHDLACEIAVLLNLEPDHLDRHALVRRVPGREAPHLRARRNGGRAAGQRARRPDVRGRRPAARPSRASPARTTARTRPRRPSRRAPRGSRTARSREALRTFPGVEHRLELVAELGGVRYVNDSKATNVAAATRGLAAYDEPLHVILGGSLKGEDFATLAACARVERSRGLPDRGGRRTRSTRALVGSRDPARAVRRSRDGRRGGGSQREQRARSCSSRRRARASTSFATSSTAARSSGVSCRT